MRTLSTLAVVSLSAIAGCALQEGTEAPEGVASTSEALTVFTAADAVPGVVVVDGNNLSDPPGQTKLRVEIGNCTDSAGRTLASTLRPRDVSFTGAGKIDVTRDCERQVVNARRASVFGAFNTIGGKVVLTGVAPPRSDVAGAIKASGNLISFNTKVMPALHIDTRKLPHSATTMFQFLGEDVSNRAVTYWLAGAAYNVIRQESPRVNSFVAGKFYWNYGGKLQYATGEVTANGLNAYWGASAVVDPCAADKVAPVATLSISPAILPVPNHKLVAITLAKTATDACDKAPKTSCAVTANEAVHMLGSGNTAPDIQWVGEQLYLRAERSGLGTDRIYTVSCTTTDASGNATKTSGTVTVPHDNGGEKGDDKGKK